MKQFTVLTVSKRTGWEDGARESIRRQTLKPKEWIVITEGQAATFDLPASVYQAPVKTQASNLNASLNFGLKKVTTPYVIFYQDFIDLASDCFAKLMALAEPSTLVTTCTPDYDGSNDSRFTGVNQVRACRPEDWETNVALAPMKLLKTIGGFDQRLDSGWSWDNVSVASRAAMVGAVFLLDETNRPTLLDHEQTSKLAMKTNGDLHNLLIQQIRQGLSPLKLPYL